jgi:hypothetical protein
MIKEFEIVLDKVKTPELEVNQRFDSSKYDGNKLTVATNLGYKAFKVKIVDEFGNPLEYNDTWLEIVSYVVSGEIDGQ